MKGLQFALETDSISTLESAIRKAHDADIEEVNLVGDAEDVLARLNAAKALSDVVQTKELNDIQYALRHAESVGLSGEALAEATAEIARITNAAALTSARTSNDRVTLGRAVKAAKFSNVDADEVMPLTQSLRNLTLTLTANH